MPRLPVTRTYPLRQRRLGARCRLSLRDEVSIERFGDRPFFHYTIPVYSIPYDTMYDHILVPCVCPFLLSRCTVAKKFYIYIASQQVLSVKEQEQSDQVLYITSWPPSVQGWVGCCPRGGSYKKGLAQRPASMRSAKSNREKSNER